MSWKARLQYSKDIGAMIQNETNVRDSIGIVTAHLTIRPPPTNLIAVPLRVLLHVIRVSDAAEFLLLRPDPKDVTAIVGFPRPFFHRYDTELPSDLLLCS